MISRSRRVRHLGCLIALATAAFACAPASADVPVGQTIDKIECQGMEGSVFHIHQHLAITDHGKPVPIPADVGRPLVGNCLYWLHTHTPDGIIHVEAPMYRTFTLGNFFDIWGQPLSRTNVAGHKPKPGEHVVVYVNGSRYNGDPRKIELAAHTDIMIRIGPPETAPAPFTAWNGN